MSRSEEELSTRVRDLEAEVTRGKVRDSLVRLQRPDVASPEDAALVEDLVAMAPDARQRQIDRLAKTPLPPGHDHVMLNRALEGAITNSGLGGNKKRMTREDSVRLSRRASAEKKTFEQVAAEDGFDLHS